MKLLNKYFGSGWFGLLLSVPFYFLISTNLAFADMPGPYVQNPSTPSLGDVAQNITMLTANLANFLTALMFIIGFSCLVGFIVKYKAHRDNPQYIGLTVPVTLFFIGLAFVGLAILLMVTGKNVFGITS